MKIRHGVLTAVAVFVATAAVARAQFGPSPDFTVTVEERKQVIEGSIAKLNENYVFPDVAKKMEAAVRAKAAKGEYDKITSAKELADKLTADFRAVSNDKHLHLVYDGEGVPADPLPGAQPTAEDEAAQRAFMHRVNFGFEKAERLQGNIGLVEIRGFVPAEKGGATASAAMNFVANTDALIIDLRRNGGGEPSMIAYVTSYLFDEPTHLNDIWERPTNATQNWWTLPYVPGPKFGGKKPLFVLTSGNTFSGGEEFAYNLKNLKRATLIGETTGGGAHPVQPYKVSDHFAIGVPFARAINPITKTNWEGKGVEPDVKMTADQAFDHAYTMALESVLKTANDPQLKAALERLLAERKK